MRLLTGIALVLAAALGAGGPAAGTPSAPIAAYALAAPRDRVPSGLLARAVVPAGAACPDLTADGRALPMRLRPVPPTTGAAFSSIIVCERAVPPGTARAEVGPTPVPAAMPSRIRRLAVFGDTGCTINPFQVQDCASPAAWPLGRIARRIAASSPDALVYLGDFFYREGPCREALAAFCGGSPPPVAGLPFDDSAHGWQADALTPLAPLLQTAPIIVTRGNHEECSRAGNGYFLFFDPRPGTAGLCAPAPGPAGALVAPAPAPSPSFAIDLPVARGRTLRLVMVDSANGSDTTIDAYAPVQRTAYVQANALSAPAPGRESWLVTHRPAFGHVSTQLATGSPTWTPWTSLDQQAASLGLLGRYQLIASSHLHLAQAVQIPGQPGQLVLGNGGTLLDPATGYATPSVGPLTNPVTGASLVPGVAAYPAPSADWTDVRFGYAIARPLATAGAWAFTMRDDAGRAYATCTLARRHISCRAA